MKTSSGKQGLFSPLHRPGAISIPEILCSKKRPIELYLPELYASKEYHNPLNNFQEILSAELLAFMKCPWTWSNPEYFKKLEAGSSN